MVGITGDLQGPDVGTALANQNGHHEHETLFTPAIGNNGTALVLGCWTNDPACYTAQGRRSQVVTATSVVVQFIDKFFGGVCVVRTELHVLVARALTEYEIKKLHGYGSR
ncbi:hypothetical protein D1872_314370 [compost metagenome]